MLRTAVALVTLASLTCLAQARITEIRVEAAEPFAENAPWGEAGPYVRIRGTAKGELDPDVPQNRVIADLDKAPRNGRGLVEYETDIFILRPADPAKGSGVLLYEVNNRGRKFLLPWIEEAPQTSPGGVNDPKTKADSGFGLTLARGHTIVWSGWDPDAPRSQNGMTIRVPVAQERGAAGAPHPR